MRILSHTGYLKQLYLCCLNFIIAYMFTILIKKHGANQFIGSVKEIPLLGKLEGSDSAVLISRFKEELQFLIKDCPELQSTKINVTNK